MQALVAEYRDRWTKYKGIRPKPQSLVARDNQGRLYLVLYQLDHYLRLFNRDVIYHCWSYDTPKVTEDNVYYLGHDDPVLEAVIEKGPDDIYFVRGLLGV